MTNPPDLRDWQALAARLDTLERRARRWRAGAVALLVLAAAGATLGLARRQPDEVSARRFVLVDGDGQARGEWALGEHGPMLVLRGELGGVSVRMDESGPRIGMGDGENERFQLTVTPRETSLSLDSEDGEEMIELSATAHGGRLEVDGALGEVVARADVHDALPSITITDTAGTRVFAAPPGSR